MIDRIDNRQALASAYNLIVSLTPGSRLGVYEILALLGSGGMGEVYRARDTRLKRDVALKILSPWFSADADRLARFQREAEVLASLNHSHIAAIYGIEESTATKALVLELVSGETLAERISRGPIPVPEVLNIARQIAAGLDAAHEKGIVHRDLKPANIKITSAGAVKVLDFGLAKLAEPSSVDVNPTAVAASPTITSPALMTAAGMILGTAAYMSPEQARGLAVDKRADIWALGCILFEMLSGRRAFPGDTISDVIASVLKSQPDYSALPPVNSRLRALLQRSLEKDPGTRWRDVGDLRFELEHADDAGPIEDGLVGGSRIGPRERVAWLLALLLAAVTVTVAMRWLGTTRGDGGPAAKVVRFGVTPNPGTSLYTGGWIVPFALSPDGNWFAYTATSQDGQSRLWLRALDADAAQPVAGSERAISPSWSADSNWVGFHADSKLYRVRIPGGSPEEITTLKSFTGGIFNDTWSDEVVLLTGRGGNIIRVSSEGGRSEPLTTLDVAAKELAHYSPQFLSNRREFLYMSIGASARLMRQSLDGGTPSTVARFTAPTNIQYARGHLFYVENAVLWARRYDEATGQLVGDRHRMASGLPVGGLGIAPFSVSSSDVAYWTQSLIQQSSELKWFDRRGNAGAAGAARAVYDGFDVSLDGSRLVSAEVVEDGPALWVKDLATGGRFPLRLNPSGTVPLWAPDNRHIVFLSLRALHYADVDNLAVAPIQLTAPSRNQLAQDWTRSGEQLLYEDWSAENGVDLATVDINTKRVTRLALNTSANEFGGRLSPDNQWLLYVTDQTGRPEVWIAAYPFGDKKRQLSSAGGTHAAWRKDGREVYYISSDGHLVATPLDFDSSGVAVRPSVALFRMPGTVDVMAGSHNAYKPSPDGQRFLISVKSELTVAPPINVILNWPQVLSTR